MDTAEVTQTVAWNLLGSLTGMYTSSGIRQLKVWATVRTYRVGVDRCGVMKMGVWTLLESLRLECGQT